VEKDLPHSIEIEQLIIGALLNDNSLYDKVSDILKVNDFFIEIHKLIYKFIYQKLESGSIANSVTIANYTKEFSIPYDYIIKLVENNSVVDDIGQYAEILHNLSKRRSCIQIFTKGTERLNKETEDVDSIIENSETELFSISDRNTKGQTIVFTNAMYEILKYTEFLLKSNKKIVGLTTGYDYLDRIIGGLHEGEMIVLAGRPSVGKTAFAINIMTKVARDNHYGGPVAFISLEMPYTQIATRTIAILSDTPVSGIINGKISQESFRYCVDALSRFKDLPIYIHDSSLLKIGGLRSILRYMKRVYGIKLVVIDYLQLMDSGDRAESRAQEIAKISRGIKLIAKELAIPIIVLSQMSRDVEKRSDRAAIPRLSDLRESGAIEQDADKVWFLYHEKKEENPNLISLMIAKNRNGAIGTVQFNYESATTTFTEIISN
jgi:replicative DNA helicase